jgi:hypothetical protein
MFNLNLYDRVSLNIPKGLVKLNIGQAISKNSISQSLSKQLSYNNFMRELETLANETLILVQGYIHHKYNDSSMRVFKYPEVGLSGNWSFKIYGNAEYEQILEDRSIEWGKIISSKDRLIIPSQKEEAFGKSLIFRTSHGETIHGDEYVDELIENYMRTNLSRLITSHQKDLYDFIQKITG